MTPAELDAVVENTFSLNTLTELAMGYLRYEVVRKMTPWEFEEAWDLALNADIRFDDIIDRRIKPLKP